jgi:hypothetical protein
MPDSIRLTSWRDMRKKLKPGSIIRLTRMIDAEFDTQLKITVYRSNGFCAEQVDGVGNPLFYAVRDATFKPTEEGFAITTSMGQVVAQFKVS